MSILMASYKKRRFLKMLAVTLGYSTTANAANSGEVGVVEEVIGSCFARAAKLRRLSKAEGVSIGETVWTEVASKASFRLSLGGTLFLGSECQIVIDRFISKISGELVLQKGAIVFDRDESLPKTDLLLRTQFGQIGVRGTKFFAGPSQGKLSVFVAHGTVEVFNDVGSVVLTAGEGTDFPFLGAAPTPKKKWGRDRIEAAFAAVFD